MNSEFATKVSRRVRKNALFLEIVKNAKSLPGTSDQTIPNKLKGENAALGILFSKNQCVYLIHGHIRAGE